MIHDLIIIFLIFTLFNKQLKFVTFDADTAAAHGIKERLWLLIFYLTVGVGISLTTRFVGDVFTFAFLILPASTALLLAKRVSSVFMYSVIIGSLIPPIAIYVAFVYDISSGPTAVVIALLVFLTVFVIKKLRN